MANVLTVALNENTPAGSDDASGGDDRIREFKKQVRQILAVDHDYPSSGNAADLGEHIKATLQAVSNPTAVASTIIAFGKDVSTKCELHTIDEDSNVIQFTSGGSQYSNVDKKIAATKKLYLDGGTHTYIYESAADILDIYVGGVNMLKFTEAATDKVEVLSSDLEIDALKKLYFDGGGNTYIHESTADNLELVVGGVVALTALPGNDCALESSGKLYIDGGVDTFLYEGASNGFHFVNGNINKFQFLVNGVGYAAGSWSTFSPDIKKDKKYKDVKDITDKDYLTWALQDAKKPVNPHDGIPDNQIEIDKYAKDISKIAIGTARWAEEAERRIMKLEAG